MLCNRSVAAIVVLTLAWWGIVSSANGQTYNWVTASQLEELDPLDSSSLFANQHKTLYPAQLLGVVINKPADMLNYTPSTAAQFQVFVQTLPGYTYNGYTVPTTDFGGVAVYESETFKYASDPSLSNMTDGEWAAEMIRLGADNLNVGDIVLVQGKTPGSYYNGKYNINTNHLKSTDNQFSITVIGHTTPTATTVMLSQLATGPISLGDMYSTSNYIFDITRESGCEKYQGSLVHLDNLHLIDPADWGLGKTVLVSRDGLTFPMQIGLESGLSTIDPSLLASSPFSVTAIMDQEGGNSHGGYSLWLSRSADLTVTPEPGTFVLLAVAAATAIMFRRRIFRSVPR